MWERNGPNPSQTLCHCCYVQRHPVPIERAGLFQGLVMANSNAVSGEPQSRVPEVRVPKADSRQQDGRAALAAIRKDNLRFRDWEAAHAKELKEKEDYYISMRNIARAKFSHCGTRMPEKVDCPDCEDSAHCVALVFQTSYHDWGVEVQPCWHCGDNLSPQTGFYSCGECHYRACLLCPSRSKVVEQVQGCGGFR